ncbi:hypothetical protein JHK84_037567 [Glycine max]|nr:hypothetical protein JHK86_037359 [Glycine max]KAG5131170.1 hypothetical protein JHK84_037567 [Glycine max]
MTCGCFGAKSIKAKRPSYVPGEIDGYPLDNVRQFSDKELRLATDNYNPKNKIGRGGFGTVYQGTLRDGRRIAVKTLSVWSKQGVREFLTEIKTLSNVKHSNLVELIGFCIQGPSRTLVYEHVENGSLNSALLGYLAPEYALGGQLTKKADIYSFGVLILEIISGRSSARRTNGGGSHKFLLEWAWQLYEERKLLEFVDQDMEEFPEEEVIRYMKVALFCTQSAANRRPLMIQVVDMLSKAIQLNEKELTAPGFFTNEGESSRNNSNPISSIITITQVTPR